MYNVEKRSAPLENAAGFAKLDTYIYIYIYHTDHHHTDHHHTDHHHTVQVARVQVQYLRQWVDEKAPPVQVAEGEPPCVQVDYLR